MTPAPKLDELVAEVEQDAPDDTPLVRLSTAASMSSQLSSTADDVLGHFVRLAREAGHSWSEIGDALGVSKQAAQQRHVVRLVVPDAFAGITFERFTDRARLTVAHSETVAKALGHNYVGTEHLLLAQFSTPNGISARIMAAAGMTEAGVSEAIVAQFGRGPQPSEGATPFTPRCIEAMTNALAAALDLGHNYIGTEHLLLGLARVESGAAAAQLAAAGLTEAVIRNRVGEMLAGMAPVTPGAAKKPAPEKRAAKKQAGKQAAAMKQDDARSD